MKNFLAAISFLMLALVACLSLSGLCMGCADDNGAPAAAATTPEQTEPMSNENVVEPPYPDAALKDCFRVNEELDFGEVIFGGHQVFWLNVENTCSYKIEVNPEYIAYDPITTDPKDFVFLDEDTSKTLEVQQMGTVRLRFQPSMGPKSAERAATGTIRVTAGMEAKLDEYTILVEVKLIGSVAKRTAPFPVIKAYGSWGNKGQGQLTSGQTVAMNAKIEFYGDQSYSEYNGGITKWKWSMNKPSAPEGVSAHFLPFDNYPNPVVYLDYCGEYEFWLQVEDVYGWANEPAVFRLTACGDENSPSSN